MIILTDNLRPAQIIELADNPMIEKPHGEISRDYVGDYLIALEEALCSIWLDGMHDAEGGSVTEEGLHIFRVAQYTLETDSAGFTQLYQHDSCEQAEQYMESRI